jgi:hypothetical protein
MSAEIIPSYQHGVTILKLRRIDKGALIAFCDIEIPAWGIILHDCKWFGKDGREWIGLPSTSYVNREDKTIYKDLMEFTDRQKGDRFQQAALAAIRSYRPSDNSREDRPRRY